MIKHVVLLKWKEGVSRQQIDAVTSGFRALAEEIEAVLSYSSGEDAGIYPGNADYALVAEFENEADLKAYVVHPSHQALLENITGPILKSFQSVQFIAPE